jgi:glycine cleavage system regulatory protein
MAPVRLVLTVAARDQRGIVGTIAGIIRRHQGSWVDSALTRLAGALAGVIEVDVAPEHHADLLSALAALPDIDVKPIIGTPDLVPDLTTGQRAALELSCVDRPGIVADLAAALADTGAIFETLETSAEHGSMSGEMMFVALATVWMPDCLTTGALSEACEALSGDLMVDIDLLPMDQQPIAIG